jgi:hypothetical protein
VALLGSGILPAGAAGGNELAAVTRRAFIPKVIVQLYKATPTLSALLAAAEPVTGGVSPVTIPVQSSAMVNTSTTDYSGSFTAPTVQPGIQNAEFNLKAMVTPIPFYVMEGLAQMDAAVIPLIEARMNDAGNSMTDYLSTNLWTASASGLDIWSIPEIFATTNPAAARGNFGNITRTGNTFWQANVKTITSITGTTSWTRANVAAGIVSATKASGGEMPTFGIVGPGSWLSLAADYIGSERYNITPERAFSEAADGARAVFTALEIMGVPIYADLFSPENQLALFNTSYLGFKIHADAAFAVAGPESLLPNNQLAYILVLVTLLEVICSKPQAETLITTFTGAASV